MREPQIPPKRSPTPKTPKSKNIKLKMALASKPKSNSESLAKDKMLAEKKKLTMKLAAKKLNRRKK